MSDPAFVVTEAGLAACAAAGSMGPYIEIDSFRIGDGYNYTPESTDTGLHGATLVTGNPNSYAIIDGNTVDVLCVIEPTSGPFLWGEIGLYMGDGTLFALAAFPVLQQQLLSVGNQIGTRTQIHALIRLEQSVAEIQVTVTNMAGLLEVNDWSNLFIPIDQLAGCNAAIIHENDPQGNAPLVIRNTDTDWTIKGYTLYATGSISASTTSTFTYPFLSDGNTWDGGTSRRYVAKFSNGKIRAIASISGDEATLTHLLPTGPTGTVTIHEADIYECCPTWASGYEYNALANAYNPTWSTPNGFVATPTNRGWNQTSIPLVTVPPTLGQWTTLINDVIAGANLTSTDHSAVVVDDFILCCKENPLMYGMQTKRAWYDSLVTCLNAVVAAHNGATQFDTNTPGGGSRARVNLQWTNVNHVAQVSYASANICDATFNSNGYVGFYAAVSGTPGNVIETSWQSLLTAIGTVSMGYDTVVCSGGVGTIAGLGFYDLTGSYQTLYTHSVASPAGGGSLVYTLEGKRDSSTQLTFRVSFVDTGTDPYYSGSGTATLTSTTVLRRGASAYLTDTLTYPTVSSSGTL